MTVLEREVEAKLRKTVNSFGGMCLKWVCPGWAGVPDRIVLMPGGRIWFIELKRPRGGVLSERQQWWGRKLAKLGFPYRTIWNDTDVEVFRAVLVEEVGR